MVLWKVVDSIHNIAMMVMLQMLQNVQSDDSFVSWKMMMMTNDSIWIVDDG
jgi:hypothetical protein